MIEWVVAGLAILLLVALLAFYLFGVLGIATARMIGEIRRRKWSSAILSFLVLVLIALLVFISGGDTTGRY